MSSDALDPELTLKATPPRTPRHLIARERLALGDPRWHDKRMLMLQAPAGYGKTALLLQWRREALLQGDLFLWLALDGRDVPERFVRGLQTALTLSGGAALGSRVPELHGQEALAMERLTAWLAQVSLLSSQVLLVLDEIHRAPHAAAARYLRYMVLNAPANQTIVLASQTVLAAAASHSVADGQFGVIGTQDLLLNREEAMQVLRSHLGERIDAGMGLRVHDITGGWPLGVQILANATKHSPDPRPTYNVSYWMKWKRRTWTSWSASALPPCSRRICARPSRAAATARRLGSGRAQPFNERGGGRHQCAASGRRAGRRHGAGPGAAGIHSLPRCTARQVPVLHAGGPDSPARSWLRPRVRGRGDRCHALHAGARGSRLKKHSSPDTRWDVGG
jgi:hypothetical protein